MDIFNRIPAISEDTLQYTLFLPPGSSDKTSAITLAACIQTYIDTLLPDFIWHRDPFQLKAASDSDFGGNTWLLEGRMRVGDCVDDEWCTVWLLREISKKWDVVISVSDSDGEFLLIEAAEVLPSWVKPTNSKNRVWIYKSRLHLIPLSHVSPLSGKHHHKPFRMNETDGTPDNNEPEDSDEFISAKDAIKLIRDTSVITFASTPVENAVWQRVSGYPTAARNHIHCTKAYLPIDIARSLVKKPFLVQKAVETFYTRDAIQLRSAHRMTRFPPNSSVLCTVRLTRTAYAQLLGQKFFPPKIFGHWHEPEGTKEWKWHDVGMKIAIGYEILYQENKKRPNLSTATTGVLGSSIEARKDALRRNSEYTKYIQNLISVGYFRDEIEGSELWNVLENNATNVFEETLRDDGAQRPSFAAQVDTTVLDPSILVTISEDEEDTDDWLNLNSEDFEAALEQAMGTSQSNTHASAAGTDALEEGAMEEHLASKQASRLKELATKVEHFVEGEGDLEGAVFEDEKMSDESLSDQGSQSEFDTDDVDDQATRQIAMEKLVPGLDPLEYGKMPSSFYRNSQRVAPTIVETDPVRDTTKEALPQKRMSGVHPEIKPLRKPLIPRDQYDGVDSDDETDMDEGTENEESDEERPQVVGDIEVDMEEEEEEFLEFSRQALGITNDQWNEIIRDRQQRGAFVPTSASVASLQNATTLGTTEQLTRRHSPTPGLRSSVDPNLDSFEAVMQAMDIELARTQSSAKKSALSFKNPAVKSEDKGKARAEDEDENIEAAMDAELRAALDHGDDEDENEIEEPMDYNLIKNFLESFKSQAGLSGPVGSLAGRLQPGWQIPRDVEES